MMKKSVPASVCLLLAVLSAPAAADGPDEVEQAMIDWIDAHAQEAVDLLEETVNIGSGTMNPEGVREVARVLEPELEALGLDVEWIEQPPELQRAGHLVARQLDSMQLAAKRAAMLIYRLTRE